MYVGHVAIALALKARAPEVPLVPLALASYGPDWLEVALMIPERRESMAPFTHSMPAVALGAAAAALAWRLVARRPGAMSIALAWLLHWPADFITGRKPVIGLDSLIGLDLYRLPPADLFVETLCVVAGCALYARTFARTPPRRRVVIALALALVIMQVGMLYVSRALDAKPWTPSLAQRVQREHLVSGQESQGITPALASSCMALAPVAGTLTASQSWAPRARRA